MKNRSEKIALINTNEIKPHPKNRNKHSKEQIERLKKIISYSGFRNPLIISNQSGYLISGHARLHAAIEMGLEKVPVIFQDFDDEEMEYQHLTADNAIALWAELEMPSIHYDITQLNELFDKELLGLRNSIKIIDEKFDPSKEWVGMPEFNQPNEMSYRKVIVHFENEEDVKTFFKLIGQNDTGKTKSIWFPMQEKNDSESKRY